MILWVRSRGVKEDYTWKCDPGGSGAPDGDSRQYLRLLDGDKPGICLWRSAQGWGVAAEHLSAEGFRPAGGKISFTLLAVTESEAEVRRIAAELLGFWQDTEQRLSACVRLNDDAPSGWLCDFQSLRAALAFARDGIASTSNAVRAADSQRQPANDGPNSPAWQLFASDVAAGPLPQRSGPTVVVTGSPTSDLLDFERTAPRGIWRVAYRGASFDCGVPPAGPALVEKKTTSRTVKLAFALVAVAALIGFVIAFQWSRTSPQNSPAASRNPSINQTNTGAAQEAPLAQNHEQISPRAKGTTTTPADSLPSATPPRPAP
jgi:hypothetical protein